MPPKTRGRPAGKAADPVLDVSEHDQVPPPLKKRGRPPKQVPDAEVAAVVSEEDSAPPPAKKARGRPKKIPVQVEISDEEPPKTTKAKKPAKGRKAAAQAEASDDDGIAVAPTNGKSKGKQKVVDDDGEQEVKPGTLHYIFLINSISIAKINNHQARTNKLITLCYIASVKAEDLFQNPIKKQQNDAQIARTKHLSVPVDEHSPYSGELSLDRCT